MEAQRYPIRVRMIGLVQKEKTKVSIIYLHKALGLHQMFVLFTLQNYFHIGLFAILLFFVCTVFVLQID